MGLDVRNRMRSILLEERKEKYRRKYGYDQKETPVTLSAENKNIDFEYRFGKYMSTDTSKKTVVFLMFTFLIFEAVVVFTLLPEVSRGLNKDRQTQVVNYESIFNPKK